MIASIDYLPIWKKDATPFERLSEYAEIARKYPERFQQMLLVYGESTPNGDVTRYACHGCTTNELLGLLEQAKYEIHTQTRK